MATDISPQQKSPREDDEDNILEMEPLFPNEDLSTELLTRLPAKTLLTFMCVSKGWESIISDVSFRRTHVKTSKPTVSGLFCQQSILNFKYDGAPSINYLSVDSKEESSSTIYNTILDFLPEKVVLISSTNGLLYCQSINHGDGYASYICNPSTKEYFTLEQERVPEETYKGNRASLAFDPVHDANFKLVSYYPVAEAVAGNRFQVHYCFDVYSSISREWKSIGRSGPCWDTLLLNDQGIYANGYLYWLTRTDNILIFDVVNEEYELVDVPREVRRKYSPKSQMCIGDSDGCFHYINVSEERLEDWVLTLTASGPEWKLKHSKSFISIQRKYPHVELRMNTSPLAFKDGLLFMTVGSYVYSYNFKTERMKKLCSSDILVGKTNAFPYCMSLVPLESLSLL